MYFRFSLFVFSSVDPEYPVLISARTRSDTFANFLQNRSWQKKSKFEEATGSIPFILFMLSRGIVPSSFVLINLSSPINEEVLRLVLFALFSIVEMKFARKSIMAVITTLNLIRAEKLVFAEEESPYFKNVLRARWATSFLKMWSSLDWKTSELKLAWQFPWQMLLTVACRP